MTSEWLPDWMKLEAYPGVQATMGQWAWEFLRRNPDYQKDFIRSEELQDWKEQPDGSKEPASDSPLYWEICKRYGVWEMRDPAEFWPDFPSAMNYAAVAVSGEGFLVEMWNRMVKPVDEEFAMKFNPRLPIEPQIERLKRVFKECKEEVSGDRLVKIKPQVHLFSRYLRLLDAETAGASRLEIKHALYPSATDQTLVTRNLQSARKLRNEDYKYLCFLD